MKESDGGVMTDKEQILHDLKRIAVVMRELAETLDKLHRDVEKFLEEPEKEPYRFEHGQKIDNC